MPANNYDHTADEVAFMPLAVEFETNTARSWQKSDSARTLVESASQQATDVQVTDHSGLKACFENGKAAIPVHSLRRSADLIAKRLFDLGFATVALLALAPLLIVIAVLIKWSDGGSVFFRQKRVGKDGKLFEIYKFRSMYQDRCDVSGEAQTIVEDDRVMPIGRFIRRTSIDELPQLLNVISGDMSVVGPRPHVAGQLAGGMPYKAVVPYYDDRHSMLPGLTGWAQANGYRGSTSDIRQAKARVDHDIAYIQNFSFVLDLKIVVKTAIREFVTGSGY